MLQFFFFICLTTLSKTKGKLNLDNKTFSSVQDIKLYPCCLTRQGFRTPGPWKKNFERFFYGSIHNNMLWFQVYLFPNFLLLY